MIGKRIAHFRRLKKISQQQLGQLVNIDQTLISRIERGDRKVSTNELPLFSKALGITIAQLLGIEEEKNGEEEEEEPRPA